MRYRVALACLATAVCGAAAAKDDPGPLVRTLWVFQRYGSADAADPANDQRLKGALFKGLGKEGELTLSEVRGWMTEEAFKQLAGDDDRISRAEVVQAADAAIPESRMRLLRAVRQHADQLTTSFDMIDEPHRLAGGKLVDWIVENYRPGKPLGITVICTGNSRRSILGATMGNIAASYYGLPDVRFHSGGTAPTAFNERTVAALKAIGVEVEATGKEAPRGEPKTANPLYHVRWASGQGGDAIEFSKRYDDPANPQRGFAALMVCSESDAGCPVVKGASLRVPMPYLDPKIYDDGVYEPAKYFERRDDMGRLMLAVMMQARQRLAATSATHGGR